MVYDRSHLAGEGDGGIVRLDEVLLDLGADRLEDVPAARRHRGRAGALWASGLGAVALGSRASSPEVDEHWEVGAQRLVLLVEVGEPNRPVASTEAGEEEREDVSDPAQREIELRALAAAA